MMENQAMYEQDQILYAQHKAAARQLLLKHKADDLIPMLGLEEETT